jgi:type I restriction enzyme S subunit
MMRIDKVTDIETDEISYELPKGWVMMKLGDIINVLAGYGFPEKYQGKSDGDIPFFKVMDISKAILSGTIHLTKANNYISFEECNQIKAKLFPKETIVFAKIGEAIRLNRRAVLSQNSLVDNNVMGIYCFHKGINNQFIFYYFLTIRLEEYSRATTVPSIRKSDVEQISISLPPLSEQHRIVAKIEELFTKLDAGIESLKKVQAQLKRYRQAVLKSAVEGKLTAEWRAIHKDELEPASVLLERIRKEKNKDSKYADSLIDDKQDMMADLPDLPDGWVWTNFKDLASPEKNSIKRGPFGSTVKKAFFVDKGYKVYEQQNAIYDDSSLGSYYINEEKFKELIDFSVKPGDFIVSCSGTIGRIAQIPSNAEKGIINQALLKITIDNGLILSEYFLYLFRATTYQKKVLKGTRGSAIKNISSVIDLKQIPVALPTKDEQQKIIEEIELRLSIADKVEFIINAEIKRAERLRQSILKQAFSGKLVPQDPNDEPASVLLDRIKQEKAKNDNQRKGQKSNDNTEQMKLL